MSDFLYYLLDGLCNGAIIAMIALGYTLVYGIIKLINFAHGEFFMVGAYAGHALWLLLPAAWPVGVTLPLLLVAGAVAGALIAMLTERVAYRPIRGGGRLIALLTAIGVSLTLQNLFKFVKHGKNQAFTGPVEELFAHTVEVGDKGISVAKFGFIALSAVLMLGLYHLVRHTRFGRAMRASSQDLEAARLMGIDVDRVILFTFCLGGCFAGLAGVLHGALYQVSPTMGFMPGLVAFVAAVIGGIGSLPGAVLGGIAIGLLNNLVLWAGVPSEYQDVMVFLLLIVMLVVRPAGLLGKPEREKV